MDACSNNAADDEFAIRPEPDPRQNARFQPLPMKAYHRSDLTTQELDGFFA